MAATVDIAIAGAQGLSARGYALPVVDPVPVNTDLLTSSGTSQQSDFAVPGDAAVGTGMVWVLTVTGGNIRAKFGSNPTAVAAEDGGWLILDGQTREFGAVGGHKVAVITA